MVSIVIYLAGAFLFNRKNDMKDLFPTEYYLGRNHPDPFKVKTIIKYCVAQRERIKIEVMNYERKKIKTLVDDIKNEGTYQVGFYTTGLREGIYFYRMIAGRFVMTRRMLYLK